MLLLMNGWNDGIMWATIIQTFMKKSSVGLTLMGALLAQPGHSHGDFLLLVLRGGTRLKVTLENIRLTFVKFLLYQRRQRHFNLSIYKSTLNKV